MLKTSSLRVAVLCALFPTAAWASQGTIATNFGLLPQDVATAQGLSMFSNQPSAVYYNPAYLARDRKGAVSASFLFTEQDIEARPNNFPADNDPNRIRLTGGDDVVNRSNYNVVLGFKTDLSTMLKSNRAMVLGFVLGAERTGERLLSFDSRQSAAGQSLRYGQQSLFLTAGAGLNIVEGLDVGAAARITLAASAELDALVVPGGNPDSTVRRPALVLSAKPSIQPIVSANLNFGDMLCPAQTARERRLNLPQPDCLWRGIEAALTWRYESSVDTAVNATAAVNNLTDPSAPLPLVVNTLDSYQPEIFTAGVHYNFYNGRVGFVAEYQMWSQLNDNFAQDTVRRGANLQFEDVFVPRLAAEYRLNKVFSLLAGVSYEQSPLLNTRSLNVNFVDSDRIVVGLGFSYLIEKALFLSQPVRMDFAYQYHHLLDRDFLLVSDVGASTTAASACPQGQRCQGVTSQGNAHVLSSSLNLTF